MAVVALAVVPATPLLHPAVAGRSDDALDEMRAATRLAVRRLIAAGPRHITVFGDAVGGSFTGMGVPGVAAEEPAALALGEWLLRANDWDGSTKVFAVPDGDSPGSTADDSTDSGVLVLADGTACRGPKAPGADDPGAEAFDARILAAIGAADPVAALDELRLDPACGPLLVRGLPPLIAALSAAGGGAWKTETLYDAAPFGVGSFVLVRTRA